MSVSRGSIQELCDIIESKPASILGNKFFDTRLVVHTEYSHKADKYESRFLVISKFRVFILGGKNANSLKIDRSFHVLQIKSICVLSDSETALIVDDANGRKRLLIRGYPGEELALSLLRTLRHYFPDIVPLLPRLVDLNPTDLYAKADRLVMDVSPRPCHSFRRTYAALCDLHDQPYRDEVAWDVEKIYTANRITDLHIDDFSHLLPKDLLAIVAVLQFSSYFSGLIIDGMRISAEMVEVILGVVRHSISLKKLVLSNCGLTRELPGLLASALADNERIPLELIDLSKNATLDDRKGFASLSSSLAGLPCLHTIKLSECSLSEKSLHSLYSSLYASLSARSNTAKGVVSIDISTNVIKDDVSSLVNLLSLCTSLRSLNLTDCHTPLDKLWPALKYGCLQLEHLYLSGCTVSSSKKPSPDTVVAAKDFLSTCVGLKTMDLSRVQLNGELLKALLTGLTNNQQLEPVSLILDGSCEKQSAVLEECLVGVRAANLSLRDCHLDADMPGVIRSISRMPMLTSLDLGGANVVGLKKNTKTSHLIGKAVNEIVKLISTTKTLTSLCLSDAHLGNHVSLLMNSLGSCNTLRVLDLSANDLGNFGLRILSKALELNVSLRELVLDSNHMGGEGMADLASAMQYNITLLSMPCPFNDISEAIARGERTKVNFAWSRIESCLDRNRKGELVYETARKRAGMSGEGRAKEDLPDTAHIVEEFLGKIREDTGRWMAERMSGGGHGDGGRAETSAMERLRETVQRDVYSSLSEWIYQEMVASREAEKMHATSAERKTMTVSHRSGTPLSDCASPSLTCRPRSILTDMKNGESGVETLIDVLGPPKSSSLSHPSKSRPRPLRKKVAQANAPTPPIEEERPSSPTDSIGSSSVENRPVNGGERSGSRVALLPPTWSEGSVGGGEDSPSLSPSHSLPPPLPFSLSQSCDASPPPLPKRQMATPPSLPPKPEKLNRETSRDESPGSSRRSVADMARLFNR